MIIVEGWIKFAAGEADRIVDAGRKMVEETNKEAGCLLYAFSRDLSDPDLIRVSERWENMEALGAHGKTPHMAEFNKAIGAAKREGADVRAYEAEEKMKLI